MHPQPAQRQRVPRLELGRSGAHPAHERWLREERECGGRCPRLCHSARHECEVVLRIAHHHDCRSFGAAAAAAAATATTTACATAAGHASAPAHGTSVTHPAHTSGCYELGSHAFVLHSTRGFRYCEFAANAHSRRPDAGQYDQDDGAHRGLWCCGCRGGACRRLEVSTGRVTNKSSWKYQDKHGSSSCRCSSGSCSSLSSFVSNCRSQWWCQCVCCIRFFDANRQLKKAIFCNSKP
mmetsp:Transcript_90074/g.257968  ORF Transcript_90074/g.257968 Transcript_90074/m.257968 type:complete len:237 (-) Transcript_90074:349-1059(-)